MSTGVQFTFPHYSSRLVAIGGMLNSRDASVLESAACCLDNLPPGRNNPENLQRLITQLEGYKHLFNSTLDILDRYKRLGSPEEIGTSLDYLDKLTDAIDSLSPERVKKSLEELEQYKEANLNPAEVTDYKKIIGDSTPHELKGKLERLADLMEAEEKISDAEEVIRESQEISDYFLLL